VNLGSGLYGDGRSGTISVTMVELPAPTGPFSISTKIYNWVDRSRRELASKNPADSRQLIVQVWYPTEDRSGPASPYVPMLSSYRHIWEDSDVDVASRTLTHSRLDAKPMSSVQFPVALLSHGWQGTRSEYTSFAEDLASHGYAVLGVDHPYMGRIALPDGEVTEPSESQFHSPAEVAAYYAKDVEFVIGRIAELNRANPEKTFTGKFDMARNCRDRAFVRLRRCQRCLQAGFQNKGLHQYRRARFWCERSCRVGTAAPLDSAPKGRRCTGGVSEDCKDCGRRIAD
jgi:predicted dienelactone hydrolase